MQRFITKSASSIQILKSAKLSASLPVNTLIYGEAGVGKKLIAKEILVSSTAISAKELEIAIINKQIDLKQFTSLIIYDIHLVINLDEFLECLKNIKLVATSLHKHEKYNTQFAIKIEIPSLDQRKEDLEELIDIYVKEASQIYKSSNSYNIKDITIDLSGNGITLKQSIYKSILLKSITKQEMINTLETYLYTQLTNGKTYKELLEVFEIPLLKSAKKAFKSQLQMANKLVINRITLRKKLHKYFGEA